MSSILNKQVLALNAGWQIIGILTVKQVITAMTGGDALGNKLAPPARALDLTIEDGHVMAREVNWDEWVNLPIRAGDDVIHASHGKQIRVPMVVTRPNYSNMPMRTKKLCFDTIWERDNGIDQYTGEKLVREDANLDHVIPDCEGGKKVFENIVLTRKRTNTKKGGRRPEAAGLRLLKKPTKPKPIPAAVMIGRQVRDHPVWGHFVGHK